jgi:hypothetical protein
VHQRLRLLFALSAGSLLTGLVLRAWLWSQFGLPAGVEASTLPLILTGGLLNDAVVSLYIFLPLAVYTAWLPDSWYDSRANRVVLATGSWLTLFGLVFLRLRNSTSSRSSTRVSTWSHSTTWRIPPRSWATSGQNIPS